MFAVKIVHRRRKPRNIRNVFYPLTYSAISDIINLIHSKTDRILSLLRRKSGGFVFNGYRESAAKSALYYRNKVIAL